MVKELSIFIDESGDFGEYQSYSPFYIISLVFHKQNKELSKHIINLDLKLSKYLLNNNCVHTGPIARGEEVYKGMTINERHNIMNSFISFVKKCPITYKSFHIEKKHFKDESGMVSRLERDLSVFLKDNFIYFSGFDKIKVYYDYGQSEVTKMLTNVFNDLFADVVFTKAVPSEYKLFQAADLFCYFTLIKLKLDSGILSENEIKFFGTKYALRKNYLKPLAKMEFGFLDAK